MRPYVGWKKKNTTGKRGLADKPKRYESGEGGSFIVWTNGASLTMYMQIGSKLWDIVIYRSIAKRSYLLVWNTSMKQAKITNIVFETRSSPQ